MKWLLTVGLPNAAIGIGMSALGFGLTTWQWWVVSIPFALVTGLAYALCSETR